MSQPPAAGDGAHFQSWAELTHFQLPSGAWQDQATGKARDASPYCPVQQRLERCSCKTPSSWNFSHSLSQTPPDSLLYHFQKPCVPHMHLHHLSVTASFTGPQLWKTKKMIFDEPFYTEGVRLSLSHAEEVGLKGEGFILLVPICK